MTHAQIIAGDLTANLQERVVSGLLLPFGEVGQTNLGRFTIDGPGIITVPKDVSVLMANEDHSQLEPRAVFLSAIETEQGVIASFKIGTNPEGDDLLLRIDKAKADGKPMALSAEVKGVIIKAGKALSGMLTGAAFVARGAFPSAALLASAVDTVEPELEEDAPEWVRDLWNDPASRRIIEAMKADAAPETATVDTNTEAAPAAEVIEPEADAEAETEGAPVTAVTAPNTLVASAAQVARREPSKGEIFGILHAIRSGRATAEQVALLSEFSGPAEHNLFAALTDVKISGADQVGTPILQPQWLGELWSGISYEQKYAPLFGHADLTGLVINAFRWTTKPGGGDWAGNKANVPSNTPVTAPYTTNANRFAGGHDIAREFKDFNVEGFFESYYAAMAESYARWVDAKVIAAILAGATVSEADNPGTTISAAMSSIIDGAAAVIAADATPSFALVAPAIWKSMLKTPKDASLAYLDAALNLKEGTLSAGGFRILPAAALSAGNVLVGAREAATVYELPGVPIRVEAPDMIKGGIDTGVFGYEGLVINKADALQLVTPYTP